MPPLRCCFGSNEKASLNGNAAHTKDFIYVTLCGMILYGSRADLGVRLVEWAWWGSRACGPSARSGCVKGRIAFMIGAPEG
jgi:hypothetical protein